MINNVKLLQYIPEYTDKEMNRPLGLLKLHAMTLTENQLHNLWPCLHHSTKPPAYKHVQFLNESTI